MCRCGIGRWEGRRNVASLLLSCCHSYMVSPFSCLGNVQEMKVTAEVLPSSPKLLPGEVGEWVTGSCTNLLPYNKSVFIQGSGIACWGEKGRPSAGNTYSVPRLQLCKLWAYLIHQLGKVRVRQKLQSSSSSPSDSHGSAARLVTGKIFFFTEDWSGFPHSPETQPLPEPLFDAWPGIRVPSPVPNGWEPQHGDGGLVKCDNQTK